MDTDILGPATIAIEPSDAADFVVDTTLPMDQGGFASVAVNNENTVQMRVFDRQLTPITPLQDVVQLGRPNGTGLLSDFNILRLEGDEFLIIWSEIIEDPFRDFKAVFGQRINAETDILGPTVTLFSPDVNDNVNFTSPVATVLANGDIAIVANSQQVVFDSSPQPVEDLRIFRPDGSLVLDTLIGDAGRDLFAQDVTALNNGGIAVLSLRHRADNVDLELFFFDASGKPGPRSVSIERNRGPLEGNASLIALRDGNVAVIWEDATITTGAASTDTRVMGQVFDPVGRSLGIPFQVNTNNFDQQTQSFATALTSGDFLVLWMDYDGIGFPTRVFDPEPAIKAQLFNSGGQFLGQEVTVLAWPEPETLGTDRGPVPKGLTLLDDGIVNLQLNGVLGDLTVVNFQVSPTGDLLAVPTGGAISGTVGNDTLDGSANDDNIAASDGQDTVEGGDGADSIGGGTGDDVIDGGLDNDVIGAGLGDDSASGGDGDDVVNGGAGDDTLEGGSGNDTMGASFNDDAVSGGDGDDDMGGGAGQDTVDAGAGDDSVGGGEGDDVIDGGAGSDFLAGGGRNDEIAGGAGDDSINGGDGDDSMAGGDGADMFVFNFFKDGDADIIADYEDGVDSFLIRTVNPDTGETNIENGGQGLQGFVNALNITDTLGGAQMNIDGHLVLVEGVAAADLTVDDFHFL